jgi:hypothetical protein
MLEEKHLKPNITKNINTSKDEVISTAIFSLSTYFSRHNNMYKGMWRSINTRSRQAQTHDDIDAIIKTVESFRGPFCYQNTFCHFMITFAIALFVAAVFYPVQLLSYIHINPESSGSTSIKALLIVFSFSLLYAAITAIFYGKQLTYVLSELMFEKDIMLDNKIVPMPIKATSKIKKIKEEFVEFNRLKTYSRLTPYYLGYFEQRNYEFDFEVVSFEYKKGGKMKARHAVVIRGTPIKNLLATNLPIEKLSSKYKRITSATKKLNDTFNLFSEKEESTLNLIDSTKVAIRIANFKTKAHKNLNIEFNKNGDLCVSFDNKVDPFKQTIPRKSGVDDIYNFKKEIQSHRCLPKLDLITEFYCELLDAKI